MKHAGGLLLIVASVSAGAPEFVFAADWQGSWTGGLSAGWVSNPSLDVADPVDDRLLALTIAGHATVGTERGTLAVTPQFYATRHDMDRTLDTDTGSLDLSYSRNLEHGKWELSAQGVVDSTLTSELGLTGVNNINRRHESLRYSGGYQTSATGKLSWFASGAWISHRYVDAAGSGLEDYRYMSASIGPTLSVSENTRMSLVIGADRTLPSAGFRQNAFSASIRLNSQLSERTTWSVQGGATRFDVAGGLSTGAIAAVSLASRTEKIAWNASLRQDVSPIGYGLLVRKYQAELSAGATLSARTACNLFINFTRSERPARLPAALFGGAQYLSVGAEWHRRVSSAFDFAASVSHVRAQSRSTGWATGNQARVGIIWQNRRR